jgi:hypothetical protein
MLESNEGCDEETDNDVSYGVLVGRACGYCFVNHYDIPVFLLSFLVLYLSVNRCCYCVVVVAIVCSLLCLRFPLLNAPLWSSLVVLYFHKDWNINFGNIEVHWARQPEVMSPNPYPLCPSDGTRYECPALWA